MSDKFYAVDFNDDGTLVALGGFTYTAFQQINSNIPLPSSGSRDALLVVWNTQGIEKTIDNGTDNTIITRIRYGGNGDDDISALAFLGDSVWITGTTISTDLPVSSLSF